MRIIDWNSAWCSSDLGGLALRVHVGFERTPAAIAQRPTVRIADCEYPFGMRRAVVIDNDAPVAGQARLTRELILGLGADADKRVVGGEAASIAGQYLFEPVVAREAGNACSQLDPYAEFRDRKRTRLNTSPQCAPRLTPYA